MSTVRVAPATPHQSRPSYRHHPGGHHVSPHSRAAGGSDVESGSKDSVLSTALVQYQYPAGPAGETSVELTVSPTLFREAFAADLPAEQAALMAATQRPAAAAAFSDASGPPAWRKLPSWTVVAILKAARTVVNSHQ